MTTPAPPPATTPTTVPELFHNARHAFHNLPGSIPHPRATLAFAAGAAVIFAVVAVRMQRRRQLVENVLGTIASSLGWRSPDYDNRYLQQSRPGQKQRRPRRPVNRCSSLRAGGRTEVWKHGQLERLVAHYRATHQVFNQDKQDQIANALRHILGPVDLEWNHTKQLVFITRIHTQSEADAETLQRLEGVFRRELQGPNIEVTDHDPAGAITGFAVRYRPTNRDASREFRTGIDHMVREKSERDWQSQWEPANHRVRYRLVTPLPEHILHPIAPIIPDRIPYASSTGATLEWNIAEVPHCLVVGRSGRGKSVIIRGMLMEACRPGRNIDVRIVDPKKLSLLALRGWPGITRFSVTDDDMVVTIHEVYETVENRNDAILGGLATREQFTDARILLAVDETWEFIRRLKKKHPMAVEELMAIARTGRETGVHVLAGMQRPDAAMLSGEGRALAIDTPIATPDGWKVMGDLQPGDQVFDERGCPTDVIAATSVMEGRPCYRLTFSDGTQIVADVEHRWIVSDAAARRSVSGRKRRTPHLGRKRRTPHLGPMPLKTRIVTTREMAAKVRDGIQTNWSIPVAAPLDLPEADLPIDPYLLGFWLGDGNTHAAQISTSDGVEVKSRLEAIGYRCTQYAAYTFGVATNLRGGDQRLQAPSLKSMLGDLGLLRNKHVPYVYMRASTRQRQELLAGLLDSDGTIKRGQVSFTNTNRRLVDAVAELAASLGHLPTIRARRPRPIENITSSVCFGSPLQPAWVVRFTPKTQVFRLTRKQDLLAASLGQRVTLDHRYITAIDSIDSVPVRCIQVAKPEGLYLAGHSFIITHNSNFGLRIALGSLDSDAARMVRAERLVATKIRGRCEVIEEGERSTLAQGWWTPDPTERVSVEEKVCLDALRHSKPVRQVHTVQTKPSLACGFAEDVPSGGAEDEGQDAVESTPKDARDNAEDKRSGLAAPLPPELVEQIVAERAKGLTYRAIAAMFMNPATGKPLAPSAVERYCKRQRIPAAGPRLHVVPDAESVSVNDDE